MRGGIAEHRLGDLLVDRGLVDGDHLVSALAEQARHGSRLGEVLMHRGDVSEEEVMRALAAQLSLPYADAAALAPEADAVAAVPEELARRHRILPLAIVDHRLYVAVGDPLDPTGLAALRAATGLPVVLFVAAPTTIELRLQHAYRDRYIDHAVRDLVRRAPQESAHVVLSRVQQVLCLIGFMGLVASLIVKPITTIVTLNIASVIFYTSFSLYRFKLMHDGLASEVEVTDEEVRALDDRTLPEYTILVPLYQEAAVARQLTRSIAQLDYPTPRLDVKLLLEEDDVETREALEALDLPPHFKFVVVPDAEPKTKPKACNYGLIQARGTYVVIFDAEDQPEPDQLKKVVVAFRRSNPNVACVQARLNYYNKDQNLLTRWFTTEYSMWFDLLLPGLDAVDAPIPLGGTSNHFLTERLVEVGAWDPFNVTEDADLGVRLHKRGMKTMIVNSTTYEEANSDLGNWIRQRSRWVKGYIQTWLVHMRNPVRLMRQLGLRGWFSFQMMVGGTFVAFLLNPLYWALTTMWLVTELGIIRQLFPNLVFYGAAFGLYIGNFSFAYVTAIGASHRGDHRLIKFALLAPLYWQIMSIAAWRGALQLLYKPFYWEKTIHGLHLQADEDPLAARRPG